MEERHSSDQVGDDKSDPFADLMSVMKQMDLETDEELSLEDQETEEELSLEDQVTEEDLNRRLRVPGYLERMCQQIHDVLQADPHPESACCMILFVELFFGETQDTSNGSLHRLYRKYLTTPDNLEALCKIVDNEAGPARCQAALVLPFWCQEGIVWRMKLPDGSPSSMLLFRTLGKILDPSSYDHDEFSCSCFNVTWDVLNNALFCCKDDFSDVIAALSTQDWRANFDGCLGAEEQNSNVFSSKLFCYGKMLQTAFRVLKLDASNGPALKIVRGLGGCHDLCRHILARIPRITTLPTAQERLACFFSSLRFLHKYFHCFQPMPVDQEFQNLVQYARSAMIASLHTDVQEESEEEEWSGLVGRIEWFIGFTEKERFHELVNSTPEKRQQLFTTETIRIVQGERTKEEKKNAKAQRKKDVFFDNPNSLIEMCTQCLTLETALGTKLLTCSRCKRFKYCW